MSKRINTLGAGLLTLVSFQAVAQDFFRDGFDLGTQDSFPYDKYMVNLSEQNIEFLNANPEIKQLSQAEQRKAYPWTWVLSKVRTVLKGGENNSRLTIGSFSGPQSYGVGLVTHHRNSDFNFFGPANADPATFRRVFRVSGLTVSGDGLRDPATNELVHPDVPLLDNYNVVYMTVASGTGTQSSGNFWQVPAVSAWANAGTGFGVNIAKYEPGATSVTQRNLLAGVTAPRLPVVPTDIEMELGPNTYKVTFFFPGGGLFLEGDHGLTKADWRRYNYDPLDQSNYLTYDPTFDPENPDNFHLGVTAATTSSFAKTIVSVEEVSITDGQ